MTDLSICILSWNTRDLTMKCLESIKTNTHRISTEIILVDNGSTDGVSAAVRKEHPSVKLIENKKNVGFTRGNNQAIEASSGRYLLLLNNDTEVEDNCLDILVEKMDADPTVGMACCRMVYPDGGLYLNIHDEFPSWKNVAAERSILTELAPGSRLHKYFFSRYNVSDPSQYEADRDIAWGLGAFLAVRRDVLEKIGTLDEKFFIYFEEIDWCKRCIEAGYRVRYYSEPVVMHHTARSIVQEYPHMTEVWHNSRMWFFKKHYGASGGLALRLLAVPGLLVRLIKYRRAPGAGETIPSGDPSLMANAYRNILKRHLGGGA